MNKIQNKKIRSGARRTATKRIAATAAMGINQGYIPQLPANKLARGKVMYGMARDVMRDVATSTGSVWSIQDGVVQMVPLNSFKPGPVTVRQVVIHGGALPRRVPGRSSRSGVRR